MQFEHDAARSRWLLKQGGQIVSALDYADNGRVVSMTRAFTNPPFRGHGYAGRLVEHAVGEVEREGKRVRPLCWYVAQWFDEHPDRAGLLESAA